MRRLVSAAAVVISLLLAAVAVPALWVDSNIVREDGFIALAAPLGTDEAFQKRLSSAAAGSLGSTADVPAPLALTGQSFLESAAESLSSLPGYPGAWEETLRRSHRLTFPDTQARPAAADAPASVTLDVAPLVGLLAEQVSASVGFSIATPDEVLVSVGSPAQHQVLQQAAAYTSLASVWLVGAAVALALALVAARRRSVVLVFTGLGVLALAGLWNVGVGAGAAIARSESSGNPIADVFKQELLQSAESSFGAWILVVLLAGSILLAGGAIGSIAGARGRGAERRRAALGTPGSME